MLQILFFPLSFSLFKNVPINKVHLCPETEDFSDTFINMKSLKILQIVTGMLLTLKKVKTVLFSLLI